MTDFFQKRATVICLTVITVVIVSFFAKTVFLGKPVSKTFATSSMDSLYHPDLKSVIISSPIDPCIYFFQVPTAIAVERIWQQGQLPLWNPNNACGHPIMANIESCVFSWHHFLFPSSSAYLYNLGIVARLLVAAIGTFFLARAFKIQPRFATLAALSYSLCPHILREVELTKENWCFPWMLLLFMTCGLKPSLKNLTILALSCGLICATIHPECSFNIIIVGSLMVTLQRGLESKSASLTERGQAMLASVAWLLLVGICVFCVAAPVLLPFAEFMLNSDCYKFDGRTPPVVSLPALLLTLIQPAMSGSSPFLSILCLPASIIAFYKPRREVIALLICALLTIGLETLIGPLAELFKHKPFNLLEPLYLLPICILLLACIMAEGWQKLASSEGKASLLLFSAACLTVSAVPPLLHYTHTPLSSLDWDVDKYALVWSAWKRDTAIALGGCLLLAVSKIKRNSFHVVEIVLVTAFISQLSVSRLSLPTHESFTYKPLGPFEWLQKHPGRTLSLGRHFAVPNTNLVWDICDLRHFNGLYLPRYLDFQNLCGGRRYFATHYYYEDSLTNIIDLASVRYLSGRLPLFSTSNLRADLRKKFESLCSFQQDFAIVGTPIAYDRKLQQASCLLKWQGAANLIRNEKIQFVVLNQNNDEVWSSDEFALEKGDSHIPEISQIGRWIIPQKNSKERLKLAIRINNIWSNQPVWPLNSLGGTSKNNAIVATIEPCAPEATEHSSKPSPFNLIKELSDGSRIYENTAALPPAYTIAANRVIIAQGQAQARKLISSPDFKPTNSAVIEETQHGPLKETTTRPTNPASIMTAAITRPHANQVVVEADCTEPSYLILTDSYYPGWKAYLNDSQEPIEILRANYLFRAVRLQAGHSKVVFKYQPQSLINGFILFTLVTSALTFLVLWRKVKSIGVQDEVVK
jgi:hypothetical protein